MNDLKENFGLTGKDIITGFTGVITGACSYISGCDQLLLSPRANEKGEVKEGQWYDSSRVEIMTEYPRVNLPKSKVEEAPGPDKAAPVR